MYRANIRVGAQTPSTLHQNHQEKTKSRKEERLIHMPRYTKKWDSWNDDWYHTSLREWFLHQGHPYQWKSIHQPDRKITSNIKQRLKIHHDNVWSWIQINPGGNIEEQMTIWTVIRYHKPQMHLKNIGTNPRIHIMDNELPATVKKYLRNNKIDLQLVPPNMHWTNESKNSTIAFKDHFIAGLETVPPQLTLHLWCRLIPLATTTLNLLHPSHINPRLSEDKILNGTFDYNRTTFTPPQKNVVVNEQPIKKNKWY